MPCLCHSRARLRTINTAISGAKARKWAICSNNIGLAHRHMAQKDDMLVAARPLSRDVAAPMTDTDMISADAFVPTPTICAQPRRFSDFATVGEELDYAAAGTRGPTYPPPRGQIDDRPGVGTGKGV